MKINKVSRRASARTLVTGLAAFALLLTGFLRGRVRNLD